MLDFEFVASTKFAFGKGYHKNTGAYAKDYGKKALIHFDGGKFALESGLIDRVEASLKENGIETFRLGGVQPNPRDTLIYKGVEICKKEQIDMIIAVGGGSTIDSAKAISIGALYDGDFWDFFSGKVPEKRLGLGVVLTIPAAGSEGSATSVVTQDHTKLKRDCVNNLLRPDFVVMDPELTFTLPMFQTMCGITDMMSHVLERYMTPVHGNVLTDELCEGVLRAVIHCAKILKENPDDYDARANIMWAGMIAHNDIVGVGRWADWSSHQLEHELSGLYDVAHGAGLAVVMPAFMRYQYKYDVMRFARFAVKVFGIDMDYECPERTAVMGIDALEEFFRFCGLPTSFAELGAKEEDIPFLVKNCAFNNGEKLGSFAPLSREQAEEVLRLACK